MDYTHHLTCDGVWLGHKSWQTPADWVALGAGGAGGARTAGTRVTRIWPLNTSLVPADVPVLAVWVYVTLRATA